LGDCLTMAITFPASPADGATYTNPTTGVQYIYNATDGVWKTNVWPTNTNYLQLTGGTLTGDLALGTNDLTAQDITATGGLTVGTGLTVGNGLTVSDGNIVMAAGHGIDFSADANAAGMTGELLDDYETGTWTPVCYLSYNPSNRTITDSGEGAGTYVKVGKLVQLEFFAKYTAISGSGGFNVGITGLPFTAEGTVSASNGGARSDTSGHSFICEGVGDNYISVLRKYNNGGPNVPDRFRGFLIYHVV